MGLPERRQRVEYTIEVDGIVDPRWFEGLSDLEFTVLPSLRQAGRTILTAWLPDQTALPPLLARVAGLNLKILSVTPRRSSDSQ